MEALIGAFPDRLESARLYLRPYGVADAGWYCGMAKRNHTHLARFESGNAAFGIGSEADAAAVLRSFEENWRQRTAFFLGVFLKKSDAFVAQLYVGVASTALPGFTLGFFADGRQEGRGSVTEAAQAVLHHLFAAMQAHRVTLWCDDTNLRCVKVAERCGFRLEGHFRQDKRHPRGGLTGTFCYGLLRGDVAAPGRSGS
jgi:ribosomal-protein-alanine N-acetyltransferase